MTDKEFAIEKIKEIMPDDSKIYINTFAIKYSEEVHTPLCDDRLQEKSITIKWTEILRQEIEK